MKGHLLIEKYVSNKKGTDRFAQNITKYFGEGDAILFYGNLGSGKTYIIKKIVSFMGVDVEASSPSFSIINQYQGDYIFNHMDFYRIESKNELFNLGLDELLTSDAINLIEWPDIIQDIITWPHYRLFINRAQNDENGRFFKFFRHNG